MTNAGEVKRAARAALVEGGSYWLFFAGFTVMNFLVGALMVLAGFVLIFCTVAAAAFFGVAREPDPRELFSFEWLASLPLGMWGYLLAASVLLTFALLFVIGFATWGKYAMGLAAARRNLSFGHAFSGWGHSFHMGWIELVRLTYLQLWFLLLVVPGVVKTFSYAMTSFVAVDHPDWSASRCISESRRLMAGSRLRYFCLLLSFLPWFVVAAAAGLIPFLGQFSFNLLAPYLLSSMAVFYEDLRARNEPDAAAEQPCASSAERHNYETPDETPGL